MNRAEAIDRNQVTDVLPDIEDSEANDLIQWKEIELASLAEIVSGATPKTSINSYWGGDIEWATPKDLSNPTSKFIDSTPKKITREGLKSCSARLLPAHSVLFSSRAPIGHVAINRVPMCTNQGFKSFVTDEKKLHADFLYWWLKTHTDFLQSLGNGATFKEVSKAIVSKIKIPLPFKNGKPDLDEQKRIAAILDKADAIRRKRRQALQLTDDFLRSLFLDMFGDPVTNPKGWDVKPLGGICDVRDGTHDSPRYVDEGRYLLTSKNFKDGMISYEGASMISQSDFDAINKRSKVDAGDIVMPMIGTIGNPFIVRNEPDFAIKNVALIKFSEESPSNYYIKALLCSHYFDHITQKSNRGGTQKFLSLGDIRSIPVPIPDEFEETRFQAITRKTQETLEKLEETSTGTLFASLQQRAFKGEL